MATAPGLSFWIPLPIGRRAEILRDPLNFLLRAREQHGDVYRVRLGPLVTHFVFHPDHVRHVLHERPKNYVRGWQYRLLRRLLGDNLIVNDGETWLRQRKLAQPAFARERLARYAEVMVQATADLLGRWEQGAAEQTVDIGAQMRRLALEIAGRTLFSRDVSGETDVVGGSFATVAGYLKRRFDRPFVSPPTWVPTPANRGFKRAARQLNRLVLEIVRERRRDERDRGDLLSMLMAAKDDETSARLDDRQLTSTVLAFLLAGHETTATALTWSWFLLGTHPAIRERVRAEAETVLGDRPPTFADAARLDTARRVSEIDAALSAGMGHSAAGRVRRRNRRLPHPGPLAGDPLPLRHAPAPGGVGPAGRLRSRSLLAGAIRRGSKYAHFPFIAGPHQCIGAEFAMLEMRLVVAMVLRDYDVELARIRSSKSSYRSTAPV